MEVSLMDVCIGTVQNANHDMLPICLLANNGKHDAIGVRSGPINWSLTPTRYLADDALNVYFILSNGATHIE